MGTRCRDGPPNIADFHAGVRTGATARIDSDYRYQGGGLPWRHHHHGHLAQQCSGRVCGLDPRAVAVIRVQSLWLAVQPLDMRAGTESALARVVAAFGAAHPHQAYVFLNRRGDRMKVLVHDGIGIWLAARRLNQGGFARVTIGTNRELTRAQFDALVLGLPWERVGKHGVITVV
jgi:transposase